MITKLEADEIAALFVAGLDPNLDLVVLADKTRSLPSGWLYFFVTKRFLETQDDMDMLVGSGPFLVLADRGGILQLGTGLPVEDYLSDLENLLQHQPLKYVTTTNGDLTKA